MRWLFPLCVGGLALLGVGSALVDWRDSRALKAIDAPREEPVLAEQETEFVRRAAGATLVSGRPYARLGARLRREGELETEPRRRVEMFCEALGMVGEAIRREPRNAAYLINWANLRQLLGSVRCSERYTEGDFRKVAAFALAADSTNTRVIYAAAQLALWSGDEGELDRLLNRFLTLKLEVRPNETEFVFSNMLNPERLKRIVPGRFPYVLQWAKLMRERKPELFRELSSTWATLQLEAIEESRAALVAQKIPADLHRRRLGELGGVAAGSNVQQTADRELADIYRRIGGGELAAYYTARSELEELAVVRAVQKSDTRPAATALVAWGHDDIATFDEFYTSLGFYVPVGYQPRLVEVAAVAPGAAVEGAVIQLMGSNDNATWVQLSDRVQVTALNLGQTPTVTLRLEGGNFRYWKIHYGSSDRPRSFRNALVKLVKVYGVRWSE